jgi:hypothetical protein
MNRAPGICRPGPAPEPADTEPSPEGTDMTVNRAGAAAGAGDARDAGLPLSTTERTRHRRLRALGRAERESLYAVLGAGLVAHLGAIVDGWPMVVPTVYGFDARTLYLHGSVASRSLATAGSPVCVTVTLADGLVLARRRSGDRGADGPRAGGCCPVGGPIRTSPISGPARRTTPSPRPSTTCRKPGSGPGPCRRVTTGSRGSCP